MMQRNRKWNKSIGRKSFLYISLRFKWQLKFPQWPLLAIKWLYSRYMDSQKTHFCMVTVTSKFSYVTSAGSKVYQVLTLHWWHPNMIQLPIPVHWQNNMWANNSRQWHPYKNLGLPLSHHNIGYSIRGAIQNRSKIGMQTLIDSNRGYKCIRLKVNSMLRDIPVPVIIRGKDL